MTDHDLLEMIKKDESRNYGFNLLINKYQRKIFSQVIGIVIIRDDAEDVIQEAFIKIWKKIGDLKDEAKLEAWITKIAVNEALTFLRRKRIKNLIKFENADNEMRDELDSNPVLSGDEIQRKFRKALVTLGDKQRTIFNMRYFEEKKFKEIAGLLDLSTGTVKAAYHKSVKKIEKKIKEDEMADR